MRYSPIWLIGAALTGCASSTGILPAGPDTYTLNEHFAPIRGGATTAQQAALTKANAYCAEQGRQFVPVDLSKPASGNPYGPTDYSVTFRCLRPDDPAVKNFQLQRAPNYIIEERQR